MTTQENEDLNRKICWRSTILCKN